MSQMFDRSGNAVLHPSDFERRSWPEDFAHENGNYTCTCCECGETFIGHKRRVVCKVCSTSPKCLGCGGKGCQTCDWFGVQ